LTPTKLVGWVLLAAGLIVLSVSIIYESSILAFIGLGLTFWGPLLFYISTEKLVKQTLLDSTITPSLENLDKILTELKYQGKGIYLSPKYLKDFETSKIFIPKNKYVGLPAPEEIQKQENKIFLENPEALLINPPGLSLSKLFEETLGTSFTEVDLKYLQQSLPKLFVEDLQISEALEMQINPGLLDTKTIDSVSPIKTEYDTIQVKITSSVYEAVCKEARKLTYIGGTIGCPICSAIACALAKAAGNPVIIEKIHHSTDGKTIEANFRLLETIESREPIEAIITEAAESQVRRARTRFLLNLAGFLMTAFGSLILAFVSWVTWFDATTWHKDLALIFFGSRTGETISLGVGMKLIYYLLIGLVLFLTGLIIFLQRRQRKVQK
jgi:hypothetical protein